MLRRKTAKLKSVRRTRRVAEHTHHVALECDGASFQPAVMRPESRGRMNTKTKLRIPGFDVSIGDLVEDELTGFRGILTTHIRHLTGCDTAWVLSDDNKWKKDDRERHYDLPRLTLIEKNPKGIIETPTEVPPAG